LLLPPGLAILGERTQYHGVIAAAAIIHAQSAFYRDRIGIVNLAAIIFSPDVEPQYIISNPVQSIFGTGAEYAIIGKYGQFPIEQINYSKQWQDEGGKPQPMKTAGYGSPRENEAAPNNNDVREDVSPQHFDVPYIGKVLAATKITCRPLWRRAALNIGAISAR
jgi:hypothetical protein